MASMFSDCDSDLSDIDSGLGSSPPNRPVISEGSDLFKSVLGDFMQDDSRLCRANIDKAMKSNAGITDTVQRSCDTCKRCLRDKVLCRCNLRTSKSEIHRVQWIDEIYDKPLAMERTISVSDEGRTSPSLPSNDCVKPILKHKANCIIIISE